MPFYTFRQNNSFGKWIGPQIIIIEADNHDEANELAQNHGIYFDGCADGRDCSCCGDRWSMAWEHQGTEQPEIYGISAQEYLNESGKDIKICRKDGTEKTLVAKRDST